MENPYKIGKNFYLRHPILSDVEGGWYKWFSDPETAQYLADQYWPNSKERQESFFHSLKDKQNDMVLSIVDIKTNQHIGVCGLSRIRWVHKYCDSNIVIGEKKYKSGSNYFEIQNMLLEIAFLKLGIRMVMSYYSEIQKVVQKTESIFGFKEVGRIKKAHWINGEYIDLIISVLYFEDYIKRNKKIQK